MRLLAIDDLVIDDENFYERPMLTDRSERLSWSTKRRQGVAGSVFFGGQADSATWDVVFRINDFDTRDALLAVLGGDVTEERRLLAIRDDVAQTRVVALAAPLKIREINEYDVEVAFEGSDSVWLSETIETVTKTLTSTLDQAIAIDVPGNTRTAPRIILTPAAQRTTSTATAGWKYRRRYVVTNNADEPLYRYPLRISLGDTTPLTTTKAQADGDDVRVVINGLEVERTLVTWDSAASYVWCIVEALPAGESLTIEVWYGNPNATNPPVLAYPNLPSFTLASSTNAAWVYPVNDVAAEKGLGLWHLSGTVLGALADFTVPGAWRPVATLETSVNHDDHFQLSFSGFTDAGNWVHAIFDTYRSTGDYLGQAVPGLPPLNAYDGVGIYNPLGIVSVNTTFLWTNVTQAGALVVVTRDSAAAVWDVIYAESALHNTQTTIAAATYTPAATQKYLAFAVWPNDYQFIPDSNAGYAHAQIDVALTLTIDSSLIAITGGAEEEIYELATELRIGGGQDRVAPYRALLIGNARGETGAGVKRCGILLTQALVIDGDDRTHEVWNAALTAKAEDVPAHAIAPVVGYWED